MQLGNSSVKRLTICALLVSLCFVFSFIERLIPVDFYAYGFKLGLANIVVVFALYKCKIFDTLIIIIAKILISGICFGGPVYLLYSLFGGILSFLIMLVLKNRLHIFTVSIFGAIFFNIGQILCACLIMSSNLLYYLPVMIIAGVFTGLFIGLLTDIAIKRIKI